MKKYILFLLCLSMTQMYAQNNFASGQINPFSISTATNYFVGAQPSFGDVDGDGDLDFMVVVDSNPLSSTIQIAYYENTGTVSAPVFGAPQLNPFSLTSSFFLNLGDPIALVDIDGDGDLDIVIYSWDFTFYENIGTATAPSFGSYQTPPFFSGTPLFLSDPKLTFTDIDGDGDQDMFMGAYDGNFYYSENIGTSTSPNFGSFISNPFGLIDMGVGSSSTFIDFDGDGDLDLMSGERFGNFKYFENIGSSNTPLFAIVQSNPFSLYDIGNSNSPSFVDLDNDGDFDILSGEQNNGFFYFENTNFSINTWTGTTSTDWSTASNWSSGTVPTSSETIIIPGAPSGGFFPVTSSTITVKDLTIQTNAYLTIGSGFGLIIAANGTVTNNWAVVMSSGATGTAWLDDFTNSGATYNGIISIGQYVNIGSSVGQRMFGSPVNNGLVYGLNQTYASGNTGQIIMTNCASAQVTAASPYNNLFEWHEDAVSPNNCAYEAWFARTQATPLTNGRGYSGWMNSGLNISFTGTPNSGPITYGGTLTNSATGLSNKDGWHVLSNPYPSSLNVNALTLANWNSPQTYNASAAYGGTFQPILPGVDIAVAQGFVMKTSAPGNTANFTNAMRTQGSTTFKSNNDWFDAKLEIEVNNGNGADITYVYFNPTATAGFDAQWDCEKKASDAGKPTLYTKTGAMNTSLNGNNTADLGNYSIPMGLNPGANASCTFTVTGMNTLPATTLVYLEDKVTGTWTNLRENASYTFAMTTTEAEERFELHFTKPIALTYEAESCEGNDGRITLEFGNQSIGNQLQIWNYELRIDQQSIATANESNIALIENLEPGDYEVTFTNGNLQVSETITIENKVQVAADFTTNLSTLFTGEELVLTNLSNGATSYSWEVNNETFNTADIAYTFTTAGNYVVKLVSSNEDCDATYEQTIEVLNKTTGIAEQIALDRVVVYTKDNSIIIDLSAVDLDGQTDVAVYDLLGKLIVQKLDVKTIEQIEMANQARGYYFVNIINQQEQISKKVILK